MPVKKFVLNADDFGLTPAHTKAVFEGYAKGMLLSASLCANGQDFDGAIEVVKKYPNLGIAVHLNIMEGKSLTDCPLLTDKDGNFNRGYGYLLLNQFNPKVLEQIEKEFEAQIQKAADKVKIDHLDSHVHTHGITSIFKIVCKLGKKYHINKIRTQGEIPYFVPNTALAPINLIKILLLGFYTFFNKQIAKKNDITTNDYLLGIGYTGMMNSSAVEYGIKKINKGCIEALIHPCKYEDNVTDSHTTEFNITQDEELKQKIINMGFEITNYSSF